MSPDKADRATKRSSGRTRARPIVRSERRPRARPADRHRRKVPSSGVPRRGLMRDAKSATVINIRASLRSRNRGLGQAPGRGPHDKEDRHLLSGRFLGSAGLSVQEAMDSAAWRSPPNPPSSATRVRSNRRAGHQTRRGPRPSSWSGPYKPTPIIKSRARSSHPVFVKQSFVGASRSPRRGADGNGVACAGRDVSLGCRDQGRGRLPAAKRRLDARQPDCVARGLSGRPRAIAAVEKTGKDLTREAC